MQFSRRQFIGFAALSLAGCKQAKMPHLNLDKLTPDISLPTLGKDATFTFAAINDLHVLDAKSTAIVNRAAGQINANKEVAFTMVIGDLGTDGAVQEMGLAKKSLDTLERPYFCVPGNHDVAMSRENIYANYEREFGNKEWREEDVARWAFIGLDTCNGTASDVTIPEDRMEWLRRQLDQIGKQRPIALIAHHPFNPNTKAYRVRNAEDVLGLFEGHNLKLVASGHFHGNQTEERNGILFTTTACCSITRDNHDGTPAKGYRLFHVDHDTITHEFVEVPV